MYHGSIVERNGLDLAVEALARVRAAIPDAELRIYGRKTAFLDQVMNEARAGLAGLCALPGAGRLEDLVGEIEDCDVGIIPNQRNAFTDINTPTRIFEYLALGKPVIAPRTPGIQDYFGPDSLLFFESGNADELATANSSTCFFIPASRSNRQAGSGSLSVAHVGSGTRHPGQSGERPSEGGQTN